MFAFHRPKRYNSIQINIKLRLYSISTVPQRFQPKLTHQWYLGLMRYGLTKIIFLMR